jgi:hypothetical protein
MSKLPVVRRYDRAAVVAAAIVQIHETAPAHERRAALEDYLRDELFDQRQRTFADCHEFSFERICRGDCDAEPLALSLRIVNVDTTDAVVRQVLHRDYETRGQLLLERVGTHRYAADPSTHVLCCAFAIDDEPVQLWVPGDPVPQEFIEAAQNPDWTVAAHGDHFETAIEQYIMTPRHGWPEIPPAQHCCTMAMASALGLPARLSMAADALELANRKDVPGERLMHQMSKPRRARQGEDPSQVHWFDDDDRLRRLHDYCRQDVEVERELFDQLPPLSAAEQTLWALSCRINERGFCVDRDFAEAARRVAQAAAPKIDAELAEVTSGAVTGINQVARLVQWLQDQGWTAKKLDRKAIERQLEKEDLPPPVRRVLELRLGGAQAAVKKIDALLGRAGADHRVRGAFRYHGASTGRWAGEGYQPQNLKRPVVEDVDAAKRLAETLKWGFWSKGRARSKISRIAGRPALPTTCGSARTGAKPRDSIRAVMRPCSSYVVSWSRRTLTRPLRWRLGAAKRFVFAFARLVRAWNSPGRTMNTAHHAFDAGRSACKVLPQARPLREPPPEGGGWPPRCSRPLGGPS